MGSGFRRAGRILGWGSVAVSGALLAGSPRWAPAGVLAALGTAVVPIALAWRGARGTALRAAVAWGKLAIVLAGVAQVAALREPWQGGRPSAGQWAYVATLATLAATTSVLNARRPGGGAWGILMGLLVLVLLLP